MAFVSSILISHDSSIPSPAFSKAPISSASPTRSWFPVVAGVLALFVGHAWLALRKFPAGFRQYRAFVAHKNRLRHGDHPRYGGCRCGRASALFFMATIHLYQMLMNPSLIGPYESADRVSTCNLSPLYLLLLFAAELHASVGLYRLALKWGWFDAGDPNRSRRRLRWIKHGLSAFFITLGLVTLGAYIDLGRAHAEHAGERYVPASQSAPADSGRH